MCGLKYYTIESRNDQSQKRKTSNMKFQWIVMGMFEKMQHFLFRSLRSYQVIVKDGIKDNDMLEYQLQHEDYLMKTFCTVYPYGLNEKTKFINKGRPIEKLSPLLPRYGESFIKPEHAPK